jgi:hypothetical protein
MSVSLCSALVRFALFSALWGTLRRPFRAACALSLHARGAAL